MTWLYLVQSILAVLTLATIGILVNYVTGHFRKERKDGFS